MSDYVFIMAPAIVLASVATLFWGRVYDKRGFRGAIVPSLIALAFGYLLLALFCGTALVFVGSLLMMCGYLCGMAVFGALIRDLTPRGRSGMLQGVRICAQVLLPGVIGPWIGKTVLRNAETVVNGDGTTSFVPNAGIFWAALIALLPLALLVFWIGKTKTPRTASLTTPFEADMGDIPWSDYPRPQMKRDSYLCLNGRWSLSVTHEGKTECVGDIPVPFPPESRISGIERRFEKQDVLIYERTVALPENFWKKDERLLLHFDAVDQSAEVLLNGEIVRTNHGGYHPFWIDVTDVWQAGDNSLTVRVRDPLDRELPYGKQRERRGGMWYTPTSGIWQTVWMESVPAEHIASLTLTPTTESVTVETVGGAAQKTLLLYTEAGDKTYTYQGDTFTLAPDEVRLWSPEDPYLYRFTLVCGEDVIESYFALRTVSVAEGKNGPVLALNGKPYLFHGLLDQGYFSDGIYLPATPDGYRSDIQTAKSLGFNMLRKHIKIEPSLFYYYCDMYGMVVFQDMVNSGPYSFLIDTALPTVGLKRGISHRASPRRRAAFEAAVRDTVRLLHNHPSVCYYTIFNEGWGQYDTDHIYDVCRQLDPTRIWDSASGWFRPKKSDVQSEHVYFKPVKLKANRSIPVVLSEFGGYCLSVDGHIFNLDESYGYRTYRDTEALMDGLEHLYRDEIIPALKSTNLCALVLTQLSDVEDETNGLVTYDRQCVKVESDRMRALAEELRAAFEGEQ